MKSGQGELLIDCMRNSGLLFVNGWHGRDHFTCISSRGRSVVGYCLGPEERLMSIRKFDVKTMSQCEEEVCGGEEGYKIPDHYVLLWGTMGDGGSLEYLICLLRRVRNIPVRRL